MGKVNYSYVEAVSQGIKVMKDKSPTELTVNDPLVDYKYAVYKFPKSDGVKRHTYAHGMLSSDCVVQVLVEDGCERHQFVEIPEPYPAVSLGLFAVYGIMGWIMKEDVWGVCRGMIATEGGENI